MSDEVWLIGLLLTFGLGFVVGGFVMRMKLDLLFRSVEHKIKHLQDLQSKVENQLVEVKTMKALKEQLSQLVRELEKRR